MSLNSEVRFSDLPTIDIQRSKFNRSHSYTTTFNSGELVPIEVKECLPGDTIQYDLSSVIRMSTPITPTMGNAVVDFYAFFTPMRLLWDHWTEFCGENNTTYWEQPTEYEIPQIVAPVDGWSEGSLADYFGIPTKVGGISVNALPFRGVCKIWNDWFRDENLKDPCSFNTDETTLIGKNKGADYSYVTDTQLGAACPRVAKLHDYYTSALPSTQKGPSVTIPLGDYAPVVTTDTLNSFSLFPKVSVGGVDYASSLIYKSFADGTTTKTGDLGVNAGGSNVVSGSTPSSLDGVIPMNLRTDLSQAISATVNSLRLSFQIQKYYEALATGGSRYNEFLYNIFGVTSGDARLQRSEFLGSQRVPINVNQVLQTSQSDSTPLGTASAFSCTVDNSDLFTYSTQEHGYVYIFACVRVEHVYQNGLEQMWSRKKFFDFYIPQLSNIGFQPIYNKEIYCDGTSTDNEVFGYQEAWADYRYAQNRVTGLMRSNATQSLDVWNYADDYQSLPTLSGDWIDEPSDLIERTLAVENQPQFIADFYFNTEWTRPMPVYSIPGLIDHH